MQAVPAPALPPIAAAALPGLYLGVGSCGTSVCHGSAVPRRDYDILQNEFQIWKDDPHAHAWEPLTGERSRVIARNLHLPGPADAPLCLACHTLVVPKARMAGRNLEVEDGISCESCHGPASGWLEGHRSESWTHADSVRAGMTDLRDLDTRARVCLSCHLGTGDRTVDHELLAAGHPVLSFELDNFTEGMPPHWLPWRDRRRREGRPDTHGARAWAVGQVVAFREGLAELARRARSERWPEFSALECSTCHHSLAERRYLTVRGGSLPADPPGLPRWSPARWAVLRHLVDAVAPEARAGLQADVDVLAGQLARFGTPPAEVAETAERAARRAEPLVAAVARVRWDGAQVRRVLFAIAGDRDFLSGADLPTAEQAYLAVHTLAAELVAGRSIPAPAAVSATSVPAAPGTLAGLAAADEALNRELAIPETFSAARFVERLAELERQVRALP
ncbi:MAG TPA: multiheme c-type cytochrome [Thermoanaerobaculia bacterium]